jgi:hypothetical protein
VCRCRHGARIFHSPAYMCSYVIVCPIVSVRIDISHNR